MKPLIQDVIPTEPGVFYAKDAAGRLRYHMKIYRKGQRDGFGNGLTLFKRCRTVVEANRERDRLNTIAELEAKGEI